MSYWRKLFIVVLLVLSLPVQSFAAVSMQCGSSRAVGSEMTARHVLAANTAVMAGATRHHDHAAMMAAQGHDTLSAQSSSHHASFDNHHHVHACAACAACCFGGALPNDTVASASFDPVHFTVPLPPAVRVVSFLTGGIERPPRISLV